MPWQMACGPAAAPLLPAVPLHAVAQQDGQQVHAHDEEDKHERGAVLKGKRLVHVCSGCGKDIHVIGQGHDRAEDGLGQVRRKVDRCREHDGAGFSGGAGKPENAAGEHAGKGRGNDDAHYGLPLARPQRKRCLAPGLGNAPQGFFGRIDDDGQGEYGKRQHAGHEADAEPEKGDEEGKPEQAEDDGGDAGKIADAEADAAGDAGAAAVFVQIDGRGHACGKDNEHGAAGEQKCSHDAGHDAAFRHHGSGICGQEFPGERGASPDGKKEADAGERGHVDGRRGMQKAEHDVLDAQAKAVVRCGSHDVLPGSAGWWQGAAASSPRRSCSFPPCGRPRH